MKKIFNLSLIFITLNFAFSCKTTLKEIPQDLTPAQLIQNGQKEFSTENYKQADAYYIAVLDRFGNDLKYYTEARYELAHSFYKQKRYEEAKRMFNEIISIYDNPEALYQVQPKYKKLAQIELNKIKKIEEEKAAKENKETTQN